MEHRPIIRSLLSHFSVFCVSRVNTRHVFWFVSTHMIACLTHNNNNNRNNTHLFYKCHALYSIWVSIVHLYEIVCIRIREARTQLPFKRKDIVCRINILEKIGRMKKSNLQRCEKAKEREKNNSTRLVSKRPSKNRNSIRQCIDNRHTATCANDEPSHGQTCHRTNDTKIRTTNVLFI